MEKIDINNRLKKDKKRFLLGYLDNMPVMVDIFKKELSVRFFDGMKEKVFSSKLKDQKKETIVEALVKTLKNVYPKMTNEVILPQM